MEKSGTINQTMEKYLPTVVSNAYRYIVESDTLDIDDKGISYKKLRNPKQQPELEKINDRDRVIYLGKIFRERILRKVMCFGVGIKEDNRIYNEEFLKTTLGYALAETPPGGTVRIVIGLVLSELFNGEQDILEQTYTLKEEKELLAVLAITNEEYRGHNLEIVSMEEMPQNAAIFKRLRESIDPETHVLNMEKAYGLAKPPKLSEQSDALEIAQFLYWAIQQNAELKKVFFKMRPYKIKEKEHGEVSNYYGLTEIAIRLREILSGTYIHIGVARQAIYDEIIDKIVRGRNSQGKFSKIKELYPLYDLLEGKSFHTVHVRKDNYYERKIQGNCAFTRLCIYGTLIAWACAGVKIAVDRMDPERNVKNHKIAQTANLKDDCLDENELGCDVSIRE